MDVSVSKEFLNVYNKIAELRKDITEIAKDCYSASTETYDGIGDVPSVMSFLKSVCNTNISQLNNDVGYITKKELDYEIDTAKNDIDETYLKRSGEQYQECSIPTKFTELRTKTLDKEDSSTKVATTEFVHSIVKQSSDNSIACALKRVDTKNFVTLDQLDRAILEALPSVDESEEVEELSDKLDAAIEEINQEIARLPIPTKTSDLYNDSGYITAGDLPGSIVTSVNGRSGDVVLDIPVVPTALSAFINDVGYITDPGVTSVNNKTGAVSIQENVLADWNASSGLARILNKPALKRVAITGDYADLDNTPTIPTKVSDLTNDADYVTSQEVRNEISSLVDSAPEALDTLKELADALGNDPNFVTTITTQINDKVSNVQSDWEAPDGSLAEILNKPIVLDIEDLNQILI